MKADKTIEQTSYGIDIPKDAGEVAAPQASEAMRFAMCALNHLRMIEDNDPKSVEALDLVADWIKLRKGGRTKAG